MNRQQFEQALFGSDLAAPARHILMCYAHIKNWRQDGAVWVSQSTLGNMTGLSKKSVTRHTATLRETGWLVDTGERVGEGAIKYTLAIGNQGLSVPGDSLSLPANEDVEKGNQGLSVPNQGLSVPTTRDSLSLSGDSLSHEHVRTCNKEHVREHVNNTGPVEISNDEWLTSNEIKTRTSSALKEPQNPSPTLPSNKTDSPSLVAEGNVPAEPRTSDGLIEAFENLRDLNLHLEQEITMIKALWLKAALGRINEAPARYELKNTQSLINYITGLSDAYLVTIRPDEANREILEWMVKTGVDEEW